MLCTEEWAKKPVVDELSKRIFNAITTAISIALGLNVASAFKDMTMNMRWPILGFRKRNLDEVIGIGDIILAKLTWGTDGLNPWCR